MTITTSPLRSGYSKDVHGMLVVSGNHSIATQHQASLTGHREANNKTNVKALYRTLVFKALDSGVHCSSLG